MTDRPIECSQCKKPAKIIYKEMKRQSEVCTEMCLDCPILEAKLHGGRLEAVEGEKNGHVYCHHCGCSLDAVKMGQPLGCSECYAIFADVLIADLSESGAISPALKKQLSLKPSLFIHIGRSPEKMADIALSTRLSSLNEALNDALKRENYEQAAWLRDQIKALNEKKDDVKT